jgi:WD40 repeat protein
VAAREAPAVAFSADGASLLFADGARVVAADVHGEGSRALEGHRRPVRALAVSPDGDRAASIDERRVIVWDLAALAPRHELSWTLRERDDEGWVSVALSVGGDRAFLGRRAAVDEWEVGTPLLARSLALRDLAVPRLALSPDGQRLVAADVNDMLYVLDLRAGRVAWRAGHSVPYHAALETPHSTEFGPQEPSYGTYAGPAIGGGGCCVAIPPSGTHAWCGNSDGTILVWNLATGALETTLKVPFGAKLIGAVGGPAGEEQVLALGVQWQVGGVTLRRFGAAGRREVAATTLAGVTLVETLAVAGDGRMIATGSPGAREATVKLWELSREGGGA